MNEPAASIAEAVTAVLEPDPWHRIVHEVGEVLREAEPVKFADRVRDLQRRGAAFEAEVAAHGDTKNVMAGVVRQRDANAAEVARLTTELGIATRRLAQAKTMLENNGLAMPEEPRHVPGDWYGCALCSRKTDAPAAFTRKHVCCGRTAALGPCCQPALDNSPDDVTSIMVGANHAPGCRG